MFTRTRHSAFIHSGAIGESNINGMIEDLADFFEAELKRRVDIVEAHADDWDDSAPRNIAQGMRKALKLIQQ